MNCTGLIESDWQDLSSADSVADLKDHVRNNRAVIIRNLFSREFCLQFRQYLLQVGMSSFPQYHRLDRRIPDHHLILNDHPDSYVSSKVHKFYLYPWNQNLFSAFDVFRPVFHLKNQLSDLPPDAYFDADPSEPTFVPRLVVHHYPVGGGYIARHSDTIGEHQQVTAIAVMSDKGDDFQSGGLYIAGESDSRMDVESHCRSGDVIVFNPEIEHGVDAITGGDVDPVTHGFREESGRWIVIVATIKTASNINAATAVQTGS